MPRVLVESDDGRVVFRERLTASDFESQHFRRCLAERLWWAAQDAERSPAPSAIDRRHGDHRPASLERVAHLAA